MNTESIYGKTLKYQGIRYDYSKGYDYSFYHTPLNSVSVVSSGGKEVHRLTLDQRVIAGAIIIAFSIPSLTY